MANWEFLLQKDGDRAWLPLDTPDVEILEGRYRIVARSNHPSTPAEIRIVHQSAMEHPPRRRVQKRMGRTNADGLMVILPYTQFGPGRWEVQCASVDPLSDLTGEGWRYSVQLHVLLREADGEDWDLDWSPMSDVPSDIESPGVISARGQGSSDPVAADTDLDAFLDDLVSPDATESPAPELGAVEIGAIAASSSSLPAPTLSLPLLWSVHLDQDSFIVRRDEVLTISGYLEAVPPAAPAERSTESLHRAAISATDAQEMPVQDEEALASDITATDITSTDIAVTDITHVLPQTLQICLRDPQNLQALVSESHSFTPTVHAIPFSFTVSLPPVAKTRLVLGEVLLAGSATESSQDDVILTSQRFTVTVDPGELLNELTKINQALAAEALESTGSLPEDLATLLARTEAPAPLQLSFLDKSEPVPGTPTPVISLAGQPLPPQLHYPEPTQTRTQPPELPNFSSPTRVEQPSVPEVLTSESFLTTQGEDVKDMGEEPTAEFVAGAVLAEGAPADVTAPTSAVTREPSEGDAELKGEESVEVGSVQDADPIALALTPTESTDPESPGVAVPVLSEPAAAIAGAVGEPVDGTQLVLNSGETLEMAAIVTAGPDLPSPIRHAFQSLRLQERFISRLNALATDQDLAAALKANPADDHTVVLAERATPLTPDSDRLAQEVVVDDDPEIHSRPRRERRSVSPSPQALVEDDAEPVPTPMLQLPEEELVAGQLVPMQVILPDCLQPMQVKLWIHDVQTRSRLDGPIVVTGFSPNGHGQMAASTQLTVPFGSTEIRIGAIAVELHTQRESRRAQCDRGVVPPEVSSLTLGN